MPDIAWNKAVWNRDYAWPQDGDEWSQQAEYCGVPYEKWKDELVRTFLVPNMRPESTVLEIGPGHGRWSSLIPHRIPKGTLHLADLSPTCIEFCRKRLASHNNVQYHVTDGRSLSMLPEKSVDFVWSFDTFVHIEEPEVRAYAKDLHRVMKLQSMGVIHHPGSPTPEQRQNGMRSLVDSRKFATILAENNLHVIRQISEWGNGCNLKMTGDAITVFARP
jgi:ubiquinone/menaquinone biosynthesis C-methylase UbiE